MLRACRRVLGQGGRLAFLTIQPTPGLDNKRRRRANAAAPPMAAVPTSYQSLLRTAGFTDISTVDVTDEYRTTQRRWIEGVERNEAAIRTTLGDEIYDDRATGRWQRLQAIDDGLVSRFQYTATRKQPPRSTSQGVGKRREKAGRDSSVGAGS